MEGEPEPVRTAAAANLLLRERMAPTEYVTAVYGVLDAARGHLDYANCGHTPPLLVRADGRYSKLTTGGPPLGLLAGARYLAGEVTVEPSDLLVLYTDGVVEAEGAGGEEFGVDRLAGVVVRLASPAERESDRGGRAGDCRVLRLRRVRRRLHRSRPEEASAAPDVPIIDNQDLTPFRD